MSIRTLLLIAHIGSAILLIGPLTVASGGFGRQIGAAAAGDDAALGAARALHGISWKYGTASIVVGAFGLILATEPVWSSAIWVYLSIAIFGGGYLLLIGGVLPAQRRMLVTAGSGEEIEPHARRRLHAMSGIYATSWVIVLALMVIKPW